MRRRLARKIISRVRRHALSVTAKHPPRYRLQTLYEACDCVFSHRIDRYNFWRQCYAIYPHI